jgi:hypothetical protein
MATVPRGVGNGEAKERRAKCLISKRTQWSVRPPVRRVEPDDVLVAAGEANTPTLAADAKIESGSPFRCPNAR